MKIWWSNDSARVKVGFADWAIKYLMHKCGENIEPDDKDCEFFWQISLNFDPRIYGWVKSKLDKSKK